MGSPVSDITTFASYKNNKVPRFYSKYFNPDSLGVDSLVFSWVGETCWLVPPVSLVKKVMSVCVVVGDFWYFLIGRQPITGPFWWNAGVFSSHLLQIVSTLRMVRMFFSNGGTRVPFLDQRILVPQCFFCCSTVLYGNRYRLLWSCRPLGRWAAGPLGHWASLRRIH